jgi:multidrug efflux system membrane fusion protein
MALIGQLKPRNSRLLTVCGVVLITALVVCLQLQPAAGADNAASNVAAVAVVTATVAQQDVASYRIGIGTVQAAQSVTVKVRVDGQLEKVAFTEGQDVKKGEVLAQIDPRPYQALLNQAIAQKARDQANLTSALKDLDRYSKLVMDGSIQQQTLDAQQSTVDQLKASLQSDQAQIENAQVQLSYTSIHAPLNGRTGMRLVDAGNIVHAADTTGLVVINQIDPVAVLFTLPESDFQVINQAIQKSGNTPLPVTALARDDGAVIGTGHLLLLNNQIDTSTGTFQLKALFANPKHTLWPGQYTNVSLQIGLRRNALTVPAAALQRGPNGLFVYVVKADSSVAAQGVRSTQTQDGQATIDAGLTAGERVVVEGQFKIKPGMKITEVSKTTATSAKQPASAQP